MVWQPHHLDHQQELVALLLGTQLKQGLYNSLSQSFTYIMFVKQYNITCSWMCTVIYIYIHRCMYNRLFNFLWMWISVWVYLTCWWRCLALARRCSSWGTGLDGKDLHKQFFNDSKTRNEVEEEKNGNIYLYNQNLI